MPFQAPPQTKFTAQVPTGETGNVDAELNSVPPLQLDQGPGSIFNMQGLQKAFPMGTSSIPGFAVVSAFDADATVKSLGLQTPPNFKVPSVTRLQDGSTIVASPTAAVSLAKISAPCSEALQGPSSRVLIDEVLRLSELLRTNFQDDSLPGKLSRVLGHIQKSSMMSCDPSLEASVTNARVFFGKLHATLSKKTSSELTYLKHVNEFRAMKSDLKALSDVLQEDAKMVSAAREKAESFKRSGFPSACSNLMESTRKLRQLKGISERIR
jgi:hypothetical protein